MRKINVNEEHVGKTRKIRNEATIRHFIEELSWVLASYEHLDFRAIPQILENRLEHAPRLNRYVSSNPNIHFLVGVLPNIFTNQAIFPTNQTIAHFARQVLGINVSPLGSKYEIIGQIVCTVNTMDEASLVKLEKTLTKIVAGDVNARKLVNAKREVNWNDVIRRLSKE